MEAAGRLGVLVRVCLNGVLGVIVVRVVHHPEIFVYLDLAHVLVPVEMRT